MIAQGKHLHGKRVMSFGDEAKFRRSCLPLRIGETEREQREHKRRASWGRIM